MRFDYQITANNITYNTGDTLLVDFSNAFHYIKRIDSLEFDFSPLETSTEGHDVFIRWSYDIDSIDRATGKPHVIWSAWEQVTENGVESSDQRRILDKIIRETNLNPHLNQDSFDLQFKVVRRGTESGARSLTRVVINFTEGVVPKNPEKPVISANGCKATSCPTTNFASGITIQCDKNLFRPYDVMSPAIKIYQEMSCAVSEMFGHCVRYFKTQAKIESADPILKEYSLFDVTAVKDIKVLVPDNQFPDNAVRFLPYDMDFGDGLEVHIVREHFERAFGQDDLPEQKDYIYFPLLDRIFEVHSAYLFRDFMAAESYYKVMLYKWQDKLNVMRDNPEIDKYVNDLHESLDEVLGPEIEREYQEITKPMQYQTVAIGGFDHVRSHIHEKLIIETKDLSNYFTIVGKYFYAMNQNMTKNDIAVKYKLAVNRTIEDNTAFSMWFKPQGTSGIDVLIDGYNTQEQKGIGITLDYDDLTGNTKSVSVVSNQQSLRFDKNFPALSKTDWYAIVVNHMNDYKQVSVHIWRMKYNSALPPQGQMKTTDLQLVFTQVLSLVPEAIYPTNTYWQLRAGNTLMTNIRIWKNSMEEEVQPITLNQFVVRDQDQALMIDNAIPPLRMVREYVR
jgi:hypothetical protein